MKYPILEISHMTNEMFIVRGALLVQQSGFGQSRARVHVSIWGSEVSLTLHSQRASRSSSRSGRMHANIVREVMPSSKRIRAIDMMRSDLSTRIAPKWVSLRQSLQVGRHISFGKSNDAKNIQNKIKKST